MDTKCLGQFPGLRLRQFLARGFGQQLRQVVRVARGVETQFGRPPRAVCVLGLREEWNVPLGRDLGRRVVFASGFRVTVVSQRHTLSPEALRVALLLSRRHSFRL